VAIKGLGEHRVDPDRESCTVLRHTNQYSVWRVAQVTMPNEARRARERGIFRSGRLIATTPARAILLEPRSSIRTEVDAE
jgi:hypothetical protein